MGERVSVGQMSNGILESAAQPRGNRRHTEWRWTFVQRGVEHPPIVGKSKKLIPLKTKKLVRPPTYSGS